MTQNFCINVELVENYQNAKNDNFKNWQMHHRLETHDTEGNLRAVQLSRKELKALEIYYFRPPEELIWLKIEEHTRLHHKGHKTSEEKKAKISNSLKGHKISEETKLKISQKLKGCKVSEETKLKISQKLKGGNKTSFKKGHKNTEEQIKKQIKTAKKNMQIKVELYKTNYKNIMTWNEFQNYYKQHKKC